MTTTKKRDRFYVRKWDCAICGSPLLLDTETKQVFCECGVRPVIKYPNTPADWNNWDALKLEKEKKKAKGFLERLLNGVDKISKDLDRTLTGDE